MNVEFYNVIFYYNIDVNLFIFYKYIFIRSHYLNLIL